MSYSRADSSAKSLASLCATHLPFVPLRFSLIPTELASTFGQENPMGRSSRPSPFMVTTTLSRSVVHALAVGPQGSQQTMLLRRGEIDSSSSCRHVTFRRPRLRIFSRFFEGRRGTRRVPVECNEPAWNYDHVWCEWHWS